MDDSKQMPKTLSGLNSKLKKDKNMAQSIDQAKEELRDAYMTFNDLRKRCVVNVGRSENPHTEEHQVFYFKPETFLLDNPEQQRLYREELLKKVGQVPKPQPVTYLGDELHRQMCQVVSDRSTSKLTKATLAEFFKRRQYALQHMKYKLLTRWAHHNLSSEAQENIGAEATFIYGKLEYNLEQAAARCDRLEQEDYWDKANREHRPKTKSLEPGGSSLYVEKFDMKPQSLVREDDIEVYMRGVAHRNKVAKMVNKFISRCKWLPLKKKKDIYRDSLKAYFKQKQKNIDRQHSLVKQIREKCCATNIMNSELHKELDQISNNYYCKKYEQMFLSTNDKLLNQWRANHDEVPALLSDPFLLKIKILNIASEYNLGGDIELDQGFSYSYQISVFFPNYFQQQVLKSQFSIYDSHVDDKTKMQKIGRMARIDTNIFRDVSTTKKTVPSDEAIHSELKNVELKIMRVKGSASWIDYVILVPSEPDWYQKQQALLNNDNPIDSLVRSGFNFLDVNDLASINRVNEDNTLLHLKTIQKLQNNDPHQVIGQKNVQTNDGDRVISLDKSEWISAGNNEQKNHLLAAVSGLKKEKAEPQNKKQPSLQQVPGHLLTSYYTLRYLRSRDAKTKILYTLNYFRVIQKRLAIDLREFASRDRIDSHFINPFVQSQEANSVIVNQSNYKTKAFEKRQRDDFKQMEQAMSFPKMMVFNEVQINSVKDMPSLRQYKINGMFSQKVLSTCPSYPQYHATHGEPITTLPVFEEQNRKPIDRMEANAIRLMGRIETIELNEQQQEVYVKDDFGIYIFYDCVFQDMKYLEDELCKVASLFIKKSEKLLNSNVEEERPFPARDRLEVIQDLLIYESQFNFLKVKVCQVYMECYEHITDPLEQQKLMQTITDIMARRPRLNLEASYFQDAYEAEITLLQKQFELVRQIVDIQITLEKSENKRLQDSLNMSYFLANSFTENKWKYQDADELLRCIATHERMRAEAHASKLQEPGQDSDSTEKEQKSVKHRQQSVRFEDGLEGQSKESVLQQDSLPEPQGQRSIDQKAPHQIWGETTSSIDIDDAEYLKEEQNQFSKLLGLPQISLETLYLQYSEKNHNILKLMGEHSNFIHMHEGYPEFLTRLTHRSICDKNRLFKPNHWSQDTGSLDFYETLDFINRYHAVSQSMQTEMYEVLKMWEPTLMTFIDIQLADAMLEEFHRVQQIQEGAIVEYEGRQLIEDEQIMGSADKMVFYAKEMVSDLTSKSLKILDPYQIMKLDIETIKNFDFQRVPLELNKYTMMRKGVQGGDYLLKCEKSQITMTAISKVAKAFGSNLSSLVSGENQADVLNNRNVSVPSLLTIYSNMMELARMRSELILAATECSILSEVYLQQCETIGQKVPKLLEQEAIIFENAEQSERDNQYVNFVDHGCAYNQKIDLAIREFDPFIMSNMNFRNPDALKLNILTAGLEEVRAVLQYQILQKHLLIVATRLNAQIIDTHERAFQELDLLKENKICVPNSIIRYHKLMTKQTDNLNPAEIENERKKFKLLLSSNCFPLFYNVCSRKSSQRAAIAKEFSTYLSTVQQVYPFNEYPVMRLMRNFKLKLLTRLVQTVSTEVYLDAQKIQASHTCNKLRTFSRLFAFEQNKEFEDLLCFETAPMFENFTANYLPSAFKKEDGDLELNKKERKVMDRDGHIVFYGGVPSSTSILGIEATQIEDLRLFKQKRFEIRSQKINEELNDDLKLNRAREEDPEHHLKQMLPTFTLTDHSELQKKTQEEQETFTKKKLGRSAGSLLDYDEALYFGDSKYSQIIRFYQFFERIITLEFFLAKLQFTPLQVVRLESAIKSGVLFWKYDEFDQRILNECLPEKKDNPSRSYKYFYDQAVSEQNKKQMVESIQTMGLTLKSFIRQFNKTKEHERFDYLTQYCEFRYQQIIGSMHRLMNQYYYQKKIGAALTVHHSIVQLTQMNHIKLGFLKPHNYSVSTAVISADQYAVESGSFVFGSSQIEEQSHFKRCVQPVINERALEPSQVTLFQSLYQVDQLRRSSPSQYVGQWSSNITPFKAMEYALLQLPTNERMYAQSYLSQTKNLANDFMETVFNDTSMQYQSREDVYSLQQLLDAKKFINETAEAVLLKNALICWYENQPLPDNVEDFERFERNFKQTFFWKQLAEKEDLTKKLNLQTQFGKIPTQAELKELKEKIDKLSNDQSLATDKAVEERNKIVKAMKEEFTALKKKVTLDNYFNMKAEINVFSNEIEKYMIQASVRTLVDEHQAITKCFTTTIPKIQYHIHPFQQFAATFYDQCDPNSHLDIANKVGPIQELLTRMRNRSTEVETLTAGPGMVFGVRDINDILQDFCRRVIKFQEVQFKSRCELHHQMEDKYRVEVYLKDQEINTLKQRIASIGINLENIIDARLFEKGNQLIYELDSSNRILRLFKGAIGGLEQHLLQTIQGEQHEKFKRQSNEIQQKNTKFKTYLQTIQNEINADWEKSAEDIKVQLKQMAEMAKEVDNSLKKKRGPDYQGQVFCHHCGRSDIPDTQSTSSDKAFTVQGLQGAVVPQGFEHYPNCTCYQPRADQPRPTQKLAELEMLSEREAREELLRMNKYCNQQRIFYKVKEMTLTSKYEKQIQNLKKQLNENGTLWEQLAEGEKRELVLKKELQYTQEQLSQTEKVVLNKDEAIKKIDAERVRLLNFKSSQYERLKELEKRCKQYDLTETIDLDKMMTALAAKDIKVNEAVSAAKLTEAQFKHAEFQANKELSHLRKSFRVEQTRTQQVVDKMEQLKLELRTLESNEQTVAGIWKKKCLDLFEVCTEIKQENDNLRDRCKELISQGMELAEAVKVSDYDPLNSRPSSLNQLPTLSKDSNKHVKTASQGTRPTYNGNYSSTHSKLPSEKPNETHTNWGQFHPTQTMTQKKLPMTQQRQRTMVPSLDYTTVTGQAKRIIHQDIKSIIAGPPVCVSTSVDTRERKRFGSIDPMQHQVSFASSQHGKRQKHVDSLMHSSYHNKEHSIEKGNHSKVQQLQQIDMIQNLKRPTNINFDLKGTAVQPKNQVKESPRTRILQNAKRSQKNREEYCAEPSKDLICVQQLSRSTTQEMDENQVEKTNSILASEIHLTTPRGIQNTLGTCSQDLE